MHESEFDDSGNIYKSGNFSPIVNLVSVADPDQKLRWGALKKKKCSFAVFGVVV